MHTPVAGSWTSSSTSSPQRTAAATAPGSMPAAAAGLALTSDCVRFAWVCEQAGEGLGPLCVRVEQRSGSCVLEKR